jgi:hypothetical protein
MLDCGSLIHEVAADNFAVALGDYAAPARMSDHPGAHRGGNLSGALIVRKVVSIPDLPESLKADSTAYGLWVFVYDSTVRFGGLIHSAG